MADTHTWTPKMEGLWSSSGLESVLMLMRHLARVGTPRGLPSRGASVCAFGAQMDRRIGDHCLLEASLSVDRARFAVLASSDPSLDDHAGNIQKQH